MVQVARGGRPGCKTLDLLTWLRNFGYPVPCETMGSKHILSCRVHSPDTRLSVSSVPVLPDIENQTVAPMSVAELGHNAFLCLFSMLGLVVNLAYLVLLLLMPGSHMLRATSYLIPHATTYIACNTTCFELSPLIHHLVMGNMVHGSWPRGADTG